MKKTSISVTTASCNFADCVNRAHHQGVTFALLKNGEPFDLVTKIPIDHRSAGATSLNFFRFHTYEIQGRGILSPFRHNIHLSMSRLCHT